VHDVKQITVGVFEFMRRMEALTSIRNDAGHSQGQQWRSSVALIPRRAAHQPRERLANQILHRNVVLAVGLPEIKDTANIGVRDA